MIIFEGKSAKPVYLHIENDKAELLRRRRPLGQDHLGHRGDPQEEAPGSADARVVASAAPARAGVLFAAIVNDLHRAAGRSGVGTVMGSKNLKAIAVRGTKGVGNVKDPKAFMKATTAGEEGARRQRGHRPGPAEVRHAGADERDQRDRARCRRATTATCSSRAPRKISAEAMHETAHDRRQAEPRHQPGLLRLHHRLRAHLQDRRDALHRGQQARVLGRLRRPRVRGGVGARRGQRRRRPRGADLRQLPLQRGRHRPDLLRRHRRRGDGALRDGRAHQGADSASRRRSARPRRWSSCAR